MKRLTLSVLIIFLSKIMTAQCYIQYTYDASGNRIKREYVGGCAKPGPKDDVEEVVKAVVSDAMNGMRSEIIRNDMESSIKVYPNPATDILHVTIDVSEFNHHYTITDINGKQIDKGIVSNHANRIDLSNYLPGIYNITIRSQDSQIIYSTSIIKQ